MSIHALSATELLERLAARELSSEELVRALYARADAVGPAINALVHAPREQALAAAKSADEARARGVSLGPLHGLPVTIKESISTAGIPTTLGVRAQQGLAAADDAVIVKALRHAGAVLLGKTNISQTLLFHESDNPIWGPTKNPWNAARVPGGSSGGEAAAIAAGISPLGVGTDIGGSIRVPAAFCGIAGFKPTLDRWSMIGCVGAMPGQELIRAQCGPMARTSEDLALAFRAVDSHLQSRFDPQVPPVVTPDPRAIDLRGLCIGYYEDDGFFTPAASVSRGVREAASALRAAGARVVPFAPPRAVELTYLYFAALSSDGGRTLERFLRGDTVVPQLAALRSVAKLPGPIRTTLATYFGALGEARLERLLGVIREKRVDEVWALAAQRNAYRLEVLDAWERARLDAVICPAHATPALRHGQSKDFSLAGCYSMLYNTLNFPAGVVPVTTVRPSEATRPTPRDRLEHTAARVEEDSAGLPVGVQVVARPHRDELCLAVMIALEAALAGSPQVPRTPIDPR